MKRIIRILGILTLTALVITGMTSCPEPDDLPTHYDELNIKDEQVYWRSEKEGAVKISELIKDKCTDNYELSVKVFGSTDANGRNSTLVKESSGKIENGLLGFSVGKPENLMGSADFINIIFKSRGWQNTKIDDPDTKLNLFSLMVDEEINGKEYMLIGLGVEGTGNSFTGGYVHYIFADRDCNIYDETEKIELTDYTFNAFNLSLESGWNAVYMTETYTTGAHSSYSMEIAHPDLKWVLWPVK